MRRLLQICGVTIGLATTVVFGLMALLAASASLRPPTSRDATGVAVFLAIAIAGAGVAHWSSPGVFTSSAGSAASIVRTFRSRLQLWQPEGLAFWAFVVALLFLFMPAIPRIFVVLAGFVGTCSRRRSCS